MWREFVFKIRNWTRACHLPWGRSDLIGKMATDRYDTLGGNTMQTITIPTHDHQVLAALRPIWLRWQPPVAEVELRVRRPYRRPREKRLARQIIREWGIT